MATFTRLIKFETQNGEQLWADVGDSDIDSLVGSTVTAFPNFPKDAMQKSTQDAIVYKLLAPVPNPTLPIYCVGLNYHSHAKEASLPIPKNPPLWLKPAAALANPDDEIPINKFCAESLLDYEGELVFITSRPCKDVTPEEAKDCILGYTLGNDISCRKFQMKEEQGGQFFFAKGFDKFAPIGPALLHPSIFHKSGSTRMTTSIDGEVLQDAKVPEDMVASPEGILSFMSIGTTIPEGTVVMTGTPSGVGWFQKPSRLLKDGDVVDICVEGIGRLRNKVVFV
ncbi:Fumarylacetoacetate hydrolase domain-containing protein 2 [Pseudocercospora fuligena]|uniref:Fumarylacetoacetate hydrolase domain-containing protein 2 n=1 Tax=Pseudocercospora fuligena TaxID=685502 RepID=A0A8H6VFM6_9PEZI|nr:Fumarylacetoacetate hydrolase domain-containing protein 2 [Pseudocercospora fuligena]